MTRLEGEHRIAASLLHEPGKLHMFRSRWFVDRVLGEVVRKAKEIAARGEQVCPVSVCWEMSEADAGARDHEYCAQLLESLMHAPAAHVSDWREAAKWMRRQ